MFGIEIEKEGEVEREAFDWERYRGKDWGREMFRERIERNGI